MTFCSGLELFEIDYDELNTYLRNKCAAQGSISIETGTAKLGLKE